MLTFCLTLLIALFAPMVFTAMMNAQRRSYRHQVSPKQRETLDNYSGPY